MTPILEKIQVIKHAFKKTDRSSYSMAQVLLICHDNNRGFQVYRKKYAQILDSLNEILIADGLSTITIAKPFSNYYGELAFGNVHNVNGDYARAILKRSFNRNVRRINNDLMDPLVEFWLKILLEIRPRKILGIQPPKELCVAARSLGIWTADVQHGIIGEHYYSGESHAPFYGASWPDALLAWDCDSARKISEQSAGRVKSYVIGNPWHLRFINPKSDDSIVKQAILDSAQLRSVESPILVTLTWGLEYYGVYPEIGIPQVLIDVIKNDVIPRSWWLRIHPAQINLLGAARIEKLLNAEFKDCLNVSWQECTRQPLPVVLSYSALHITMMSASAIEAEWFGVRTALIYEDEAFLRTYLGQQINRGAAEIVSPKARAITSWIERRLGDFLPGEKPTTTNFIDPFNALMAELRR